jgi:hypothetical protein
MAAPLHNNPAASNAAIRFDFILSPCLLYFLNGRHGLARAARPGQ